MRNLAIATKGHRPEPRTVGPITQTDIVRFAGAGGDFNPLHHDPDYATAAGFDRPIAMGQLTAGILAAWLTDWCGVEHLRDYEVRFTAPLSIGDTVECSGEVNSIEPDENGHCLATMTLAVTRQDTTLALGRAVVVISTG
jgi:acyl dehydratase